MLTLRNLNGEEELERGLLLGSNSSKRVSLESLKREEELEEINPPRTPHQVRVSDERESVGKEEKP